LIIDFIFIYLVANNAYKKEISDIMLAKPKIIPALLFYLIYSGGIFLLAINPHLKDNNIFQAVIFSMIVGLVAYSTFALTNLSLLKDWNLKLALIDTFWGLFSGGLVGFIAIKLILFFKL